MNTRKLLLVVLPAIFFGLSVFVFWQSKVKFENRIASKILDYSGKVDKLATTGIFEGETVQLPNELFSETAFVNNASVLGASSDNKWIEVDLSEQKLKAWDGNSLFLESPISSGLPWFPTPTGEFRIWIKLLATRMEGGEGRYYYNLPNVPYVMFFANDKVPQWRGYGLHGTYWHNDFGHQHSHGCVNLPTPIAKELFYWTSPTLPDGKSTVYASSEDQGTRIVIHE